MFLVSFSKSSACLPYLFHVATGLITSVPVDYLPFMDDVVFVPGCYQEFLNCVGTLEMILDSCFAPYVSKTVTEAFKLWEF